MGRLCDKLCKLLKFRRPTQDCSDGQGSPSEMASVNHKFAFDLFREGKCDLQVMSVSV